MGMPKFVENGTLNFFFYTVWFQHYVRFDLRPDGLVAILHFNSHGPQRSNLTSLHITKLVACSNYVRNVTLLSKRAQSSCLAAALQPTSTA